MPARPIYMAGWEQPVTAAGNESLLKLPRAAFLSSAQYPARAVMPCIEWAETARNNGTCVISGFHSLLEETMRDLLLMGEQPLIWAIARENYTAPPLWAKKALAENRLLILSAAPVKRPSRESADIRNRFVLSVADSIVIGHAAPDGKIAALLSAAADKPIQYLSA